MFIKRKKDDLSDFTIYELDDSESQLVKDKFGTDARFYVAPNEFSEWYLKDHSFADIIQQSTNISLFYYLGFFQTYLEAYYHIKLVEAENMINILEWGIKKALSIETFDKEAHQMITDHTDKLNVMFYPLTEDKPNIADHPEFK